MNKYKLVAICSVQMNLLTIHEHHEFSRVRGQQQR